ncbi:MAG: hypothetical protein WDO18_15255 [Acidobacteriota bacterium]
MGKRLSRAFVIVASAIAAIALVLAPASAQPPTKGGGKGKAKQTARSAAPIDLTGTWVSVVTEDYMFRMVTPPKGEILGVPVTPAARAAANAWDPAADEAAGHTCRAYGAAGVMRLPGRVRISWQDDATLKVETEAGTQTRLFHFTPYSGDAPASWQGISQAEWEPAIAKSGDLKVLTRNLLAGYVRKNGVPYSTNTLLTEYFDVHTDKDTWLVITTQVHDPVNFTTDFITSTHFKKLGVDALWRPEPCSAR